MSEVTRSMEAIAAPQAARVAHVRRALPSGWWGVALLIATESGLFGTLIATYFYLRVKAVDWPPAGIAPPDVALPLALTAVLVSTAVLMYLAVRAGRDGRAGAAWRLVLVAFVAQAAYLAVQAHSFASDLDRFSPHDSAYASIYFTLLGVHHAHVLLGILLDGWLIGRLLRGLTNYRLTGLRVIALYWYFVGAVAVLVTLTQLSPSL